MHMSQSRKTSNFMAIAPVKHVQAPTFLKLFCTFVILICWTKVNIQFIQLDSILAHYYVRANKLFKLAAACIPNKLTFTMSQDMSSIYTSCKLQLSNQCIIYFIEFKWHITDSLSLLPVQASSPDLADGWPPWACALQSPPVCAGGSCPGCGSPLSGTRRGTRLISYLELLPTYI